MIILSSMHQQIVPYDNVMQSGGEWQLSYWIKVFNILIDHFNVASNCCLLINVVYTSFWFIYLKRNILSFIICNFFCKLCFLQYVSLFNDTVTGFNNNLKNNQCIFFFSKYTESNELNHLSTRNFLKLNIKHN